MLYYLKIGIKRMNSITIDISKTPFAYGYKDKMTIMCSAKKLKEYTEESFNNFGVFFEEVKRLKETYPDININFTDSSNPARALHSSQLTLSKNFVSMYSGSLNYDLLYIQSDHYQMLSSDNYLFLYNNQSKDTIIFANYYSISDNTSRFIKNFADEFIMSKRGRYLHYDRDIVQRKEIYDVGESAFSSEVKIKDSEYFNTLLVDRMKDIHNVYTLKPKRCQYKEIVIENNEIKKIVITPQIFKDLEKNLNINKTKLEKLQNEINNNNTHFSSYAELTKILNEVKEVDILTKDKSKLVIYDIEHMFEDAKSVIAHYERFNKRNAIEHDVSLFLQQKNLLNSIKTPSINAIKTDFKLPIVEIEQKIDKQKVDEFIYLTQKTIDKLEALFKNPEKALSSKLKI